MSINLGFICKKFESLNLIEICDRPCYSFLWISKFFQFPTSLDAENPVELNFPAAFSLKILNEWLNIESWKNQAEAENHKKYFGWFLYQTLSKFQNFFSFQLLLMRGIQCSKKKNLGTPVPYWLANALALASQ